MSMLIGGKLRIFLWIIYARIHTYTCVSFKFTHKPRRIWSTEKTLSYIKLNFSCSAIKDVKNSLRFLLSHTIYTAYQNACIKNIFIHKIFREIFFFFSHPTAHCLLLKSFHNDDVDDDVVDVVDILFRS